MLVISRNLAGLVTATTLCPSVLVEEFSIGIRLAATVRRMSATPSADRPLLYGSPYDADAYFLPTEVVDRDLLVAPADRILACSADRYVMPPTHFGLVQTKGSLARLFVSATCNDGQIEPGYAGRITLEIANIGHASVAIPIGETIAQMFVFRCSTPAEHPYDGRYQGATQPTLARFDPND